MKFQQQVEELEKKFKKELNEEDFLFWPAVNGTEKKKNFDMKSFMRMLPDVVKKVPHDIDGTRFYVVDVPMRSVFIQSTKMVGILKCISHHKKDSME